MGEKLTSIAYKEARDRKDYRVQAELFLQDTGVMMMADFGRFGKYFPGDTEGRDIYSITLTRGGQEYTFNFGQSLGNKGKTPGAYDVLACLTKRDPGTFEDFCSEMGYSTDSKTAEKTYCGVKDEWVNVQRIWDDEEIEILAQIG